MERISNKSPCLSCCSDRQIGNPDVWQSDCYRCEKLPNWKAKVINRLFDIEDILGDEYNLDRLKELVEADREGKCIVLPCKIGDPVWEVLDVCNFPGDCHETQTCKGCEYREIFKEKLAFSLYMISRNGKLEPPYYVSEKEAEAALEKMKGGNE